MKLINIKQDKEAMPTAVAYEGIAKQKTVPIARVWRYRAKYASRKNIVSLPGSFSCAWRGLLLAFGLERNLKIHCFCALLAIVLASFCRFDFVSWAVLFAVIGLVITAELLNTALESVVDLITEGKYSRLARQAKDVSAGAVLFASLAALAISFVLFLPKIGNCLRFWHS